MSQIVENIIKGIIAGYTAIKTGELITEEKVKINIRNVSKLLIYAVALTMIYMTIDNFLKVIIIYIAYVILNNQIYKENLEKSIALAFIEYITVLFVESIIGIFISYIIKNIVKQEMSVLKNTLLMNIVIMLLSYLLAKVLKKKYKKIVNDIKNNSSLILSFLAIIILICIGSLFYKIEITNWSLNSEFILNTIIIIAMGIVGILIISQRINYEKVNNQYKDLAKYSEISAGLLEDYRIINHEHKNQLIIIKGMVENKGTKELKEYLDSQIQQKEKIRYKWIQELNNISFQGLRSFMSYKILEMESKKIKMNITISKKCKKYKLDKMTTGEKDKIYSIVGVFMDNAMDAAVESKKKSIIIDGYEQEGRIYLEIANTYKGKIDIEKVKEYGYTSKGSGHGTGLHIVEKITKSSNQLETQTRIQNGYFVQTLIIYCENS